MITVVPDGPLAEGAISAFEAEFAVTIPAEYREWLRTVGGGETVRDYGIENGVISEFLTIGGTLGYDLATTRRSRSGFAAWVPHDWLVITAGAGGDVAIKIVGADAGSVWWADYDSGAEIYGSPGEDSSSDEPLLQIMRPLADTLADFLDRYEPRDPV